MTSLVALEIFFTDSINDVQIYLHSGSFSENWSQ